MWAKRHFRHFAQLIPTNYPVEISLTMKRSMSTAILIIDNVVDAYPTICNTVTTSPIESCHKRQRIVVDESPMVALSEQKAQAGTRTLLRDLCCKQPSQNQELKENQQAQGHRDRAVQFSPFVQQKAIPSRYEMVADEKKALYYDAIEMAEMALAEKVRRQTLALIIEVSYEQAHRAVHQTNLISPYKVTTFFHRVLKKTKETSNQPIHAMPRACHASAA